MIGTINIKVSASRPNMPLGPFHVFAGSAASFTIVDIPLPLGVRKVTGVTLSAKNVAGITTGYAAVRVGSAWGVTVPPSKFVASGSVVRGIAIMATGVDDAGAAVTPWKLGAGDVFIMEPDGSVAPGETVHDLHWHDSRPANPVGGDVAPYEGKVYYFNGTTWIAFATGQGDISHSEFADLSTLQPGDSLGIVKERVNMVIGKLKGTVAAVAALLCLESFAALCPTNVLDDVSGTNTLAEIVAAGGGGSGGGAVASVNGKTGTVVIAASDVGAPAAVNGVMQYPMLNYPQLASTTLLGETSVGESVIPSMVFFGANGNLRLSNWGQLSVGTKSGATQGISGLITSLAGNPTNLWNGASTKYMNVDGEIYVFTNAVYYSSNMNQDPKHVMYKVGDGVWQTEDLSYWYTCRVRWDGTTFNWAYYQNGSWLEYDTSPGYIDLSSADIYPTGGSRSYHKNVLEGWMKVGQVAYQSDLSGYVPTSRKINGQPLTGDVTIQAGVASVNSKTGAVVLAASDVGAYPNASGTQLAGQVSTIGAHLNAEDARFVSTNYNSVTHMPEAYVEIKLPDQSWSVIWREMTRWNWMLDTYLPTNYFTKGQVNAALAEKADRGWGAYDSETGAYAPDGYTWISSSRIAIAANMAYQKTLTTEGAIWVLESNGLVTETGVVSSNGFFRISDDEGNTQFEIVKGDKRTIGADASSCQVVAGFTPTKLQIGYSVLSDSHPTIYVCNSLTTQQWKSETDADCLANVTWSGSSGAWVAQVQGKSAQAALFVKATYETGCDTIIRNAAPVEMQYLYIGGQKYSVGTASISGNTVLTLTPAL